MVARRDADLVASDMVTRLAPPPAPGADFSWVKPGKVVWDYWADWNLEGVDFVAGPQHATFRYHVDFAAQNGFPYVNVDWMWSDPHDLFATNPEVDVPGLVRYAREKGVGIFVWCLARTLERQLAPALDRFQKWGVAGLKIDFFDRDDQRMMALYRRFAEEAAKRKLLVLFHGATPPWGLSRDAAERARLRGACAASSTTSSTSRARRPPTTSRSRTRACSRGRWTSRRAPCARSSKANWKAMSDLPASQGTVAHQLAMYVCTTRRSPMLSDMPTAYEREPAALELPEGRADDLGRDDRPRRPDRRVVRSSRGARATSGGSAR